VYSSTVARQRLGKNITVATNTHAAIEELLESSFSMRFVSLERKVGDYFFPVFFLFEIKLVLPARRANNLAAIY
jgi:hypothetical protein